MLRAGFITGALLQTSLTEVGEQGSGVCEERRRGGGGKRWMKCRGNREIKIGKRKRRERRKERVKDGDDVHREARRKRDRRDIK